MTEFELLITAIGSDHFTTAPQPGGSLLAQSDPYFATSIISSLSSKVFTMKYGSKLYKNFKNN